MNDEAIYAFSPVPAVAAPMKPPAPPRRRLWPWVLGGLLLLTLLLVIGGALTLVSVIDSARDGLHINIDGEEFTPGLLEGFGGLLALLGAGFGVMVALLCVLVIVPLTLLLVFAGLALALGGALLAVLLVAGLALSPLWLLALILWLVLRRRPQSNPKAQAALA